MPLLCRWGRPMLTPLAPDEALRRLHARLALGEVDFLVGAGVSIRAPSNLPSGPALRDRVVEAVLAKLPDPGLRDAILQNAIYTRMLPELVFADLYMNCGPRIHDLVAINLAAAPSNRSHAAIAALSAEHGALVFTTNFDLLLEAAGVDHRVVRHLHGSLKRRDRVAILLSEVSAAKELASRPRPRRALCVAGYSGQDKDVMAFVAATRADEIFWLVRPGDAELAPRLAPLTVTSNVYSVTGDLHAFLDELAAHPGQSTSGSARLTSAWDAVSDAPAFSVAQACLVAMGLLYRIGDYQRGVELYDDHWSLVGDARPRERVRALVWRAELARKAPLGDRLAPMPAVSARVAPNSVAAFELLNLRGLHCLDDGDIAGAETAFREIVRRYDADEVARRSNRGRKARMAAIALQNIGECRARSGNLDEAMRWFLRSVRLKGRLGMPSGQANSYLFIARARLEQNRPARARMWERKAAPILERLSMLGILAEHWLECSDLLAATGDGAGASELLSRAEGMVGGAVNANSLLAERIRARRDGFNDPENAVRRTP